MKKSLFILLALLIAGSGFAQKAPTTKLISSSEEQIVVNFQLNGYTTSKVQTPQGEQFVVTAPEMAFNPEAGTPDLPKYVIPTVIGDQAEMTVSVINAQYTDYADVEVAPSKGNFSRQINPDDVPYTYGEVYQQNAFWPAAQATLDAPYILRDYRGQNIVVHPFAYNPVTKTLRVYTSMTLVMNKVSDKGANPKVARRSNNVKTAPEFKASYNRRFINFSEVQAKYPFVEDDGEMLIICPDQFMACMQPLVDWKNQSGRPTTMVSVTEAGGNNDNAIKSYITNLYNDPNHNLVYVLFVGDYEHITPHALSGERSDSWFGQVEGSDHYPEVFIGRFSVQNENHVSTQVNKVIYYERDLPGNVTWGDQGLGIGSTLEGSGGHYGEYDNVHIDRIRDTLLHYTYASVTDLHQGGSGSSNATAAGISNVINQGVSIINYCNHGSPTSWGVANYSNSDVNALTNDEMWPVVWSVACNNGEFDQGSECFAEAWMRATNNATGLPTGAIGGMFSWESQPWQPPMYGQDEMVDILTEWRSADLYNHTLAGASLNGNMDVIDKGNDTKCHDTWILFGDPSLMVRTANPTDMGVTANPSVLMLGMSELNITADADYAIATLSLNGEVLASGKVIGGNCTLTFPALSNVGNADLVVIGYNKVTYTGTFEVVPAEGAYITLNGYEMSAPQANYGEVIDLALDLKNVGVEIANNIAITLSTENEYVNITNAEGTVAMINPDETITLEGFQFEVAENVPDMTNAQFVLQMTDGTDTWTGNINIMLHAPVLALESVQQVEGHSGDYLEFVFKNNGSAPFYGGTLDITSCSPDLVFDPETITSEETVDGGFTLSMQSGYTVAETVSPATSFEVAYHFSTGAFKAEGIYVLSYAVISVDFESGEFGDGWTFSPVDNAWTIVNGGTKGTKCAKSANAGLNNTQYSMSLAVNIQAPGDMTFMYKVSSENNYDKFYFYVDGVNQNPQGWSGTVNWTQYTQPVTVGQHTFKWEYSKDSSVNSGDDCVYIDDIFFPIVNAITFIEPASNLTYEVVGHDVTLNWTASTEADTYLLKRNGETLADNLTETTYADVLEETGSYVYAVYAVKADGSMSAPAYCTVEVDFTGVAENQNVNVSVYPNPANDMFTINVNADNFKYQLVNSLGQVVYSGNASNKAVVSVSELNKGVYFLRITTGNQVKTQKVVVE